jgi:hypothetical protein
MEVQKIKLKMKEVIEDEKIEISSNGDVVGRNVCSK